MRTKIPPPVQGFLAGLAMWGVHKYFNLVPFDFVGRQQVAFGFIAIGFTIELIAIAAFVRAKTTVNPMAPDRASHLVVTGLYKVSRNPMYLGLAILLAGWGLYLADAAIAVVLGLFIVLITVLQIKPEEDALRSKFGGDYEAYCRRVRRWI